MRDVIIDSHIDTDVDNVLEVVDASRLELCRKLLRRDSIRHALCVSYVEPLLIVMSGVEGTYIQRLSSKHKPSFHNRPSEQWMDRSVASCSLLGEFSAWLMLIFRELKTLIVLVMREVNVAALLSEGRHEKERRKMVGASSYPAALCTYKMYRTYTGELLEVKTRELFSTREAESALLLAEARRLGGQRLLSIEDMGKLQVTLP